MSWFNTFTSNVKNFLNIENPNKVLDVEAQAYIHVNIHSREDSLVLYGPFGGQSSDKSGNYELVLHRPFNESLTEAYSICRCSEFEIAQKKFLLFKDKLPAIVSACKEVSMKCCIKLHQGGGCTVLHPLIQNPYLFLFCFSIISVVQFHSNSKNL